MHVVNSDLNVLDNLWRTLRMGFIIAQEPHSDQFKPGMNHSATEEKIGRFTDKGNFKATSIPNLPCWDQTRVLVVLISTFHPN